MATLYWVNGTGNWNDTNHWSTTSGGPGGASLPGSVDSIIIDQADSNMTVNQDVKIRDARIDAGIVNFGNYIFDCRIFDSPYWWSGIYPYERTLNLQSATLKISSRFSVDSPTTFINAGTSTIEHSNVDSAGGNNRANLGENKTFYNYIYGRCATLFVDASNCSFHNLTIKILNGAYTTYINFSGDIVVTNEITLEGYSSERPVKFSSTMLERQIKITAEKATIKNVNLSCIAFAGQCAPVDGTTFVGDMGNNDNVIFCAPVHCYWVNNGGQFTDTSHWSTSSGGEGGASMPLAHDFIHFDSNSFSVDNQTVIANHIIIWGSTDFTGVTNNPTIDFWDDGYGYFLHFVGSLTMSPGVEIVGENNPGRYGYAVIMIGNGGDSVLTSNGYSFKHQLRIYCPGSGKVILGDNLKIEHPTPDPGKESYYSHFIITAGTFDANNFDVDIYSLRINYWWEWGGHNSYLYMGNGTWTIYCRPSGSFTYGIDAVIASSHPDSRGGAIYSENSTLIFDLNGTTFSDYLMYAYYNWHELPRVFGDIFFNDVYVSGAGDPTRVFRFEDSSDLVVHAKKFIITAFGTFSFSSTYYGPDYFAFDYFSANGNSENNIGIRSSSSTYATVIYADSVDFSYVNFYNVNAQGEAIPWDATNNCVDLGLNTNIMFIRTFMGRTIYY